MAWYAVYRLSDGVLLSVATITISDAALAAAGKARREIANPPSQWQRWNTTTLVFDTLPTPKAIMRKSEFWDLFTDAEMEAIRAAPTNNAFSASIRSKINSSVGYIGDCEEIDMNKARMQTIINGMETVGLIGAGRAVQIIG